MTETAAHLPKRIVLLYNGYPRLSQTYQIDEAEELLRRGHTIRIVSWGWPLFTTSDTAPPVDDATDPLRPATLARIAAFQPDVIHAHFLTNAETTMLLSDALGGVPFTIRTHSFDVFGPPTAAVAATAARLAAHPAFRGVVVFPNVRDRFLAAGVPPERVLASYPSIAIQRFLDAGATPEAAATAAVWPPTAIMSGGAFLPKKNLPSLIALAADIRRVYPQCTVAYYTVKEDPAYYEKIMAMNRAHGDPVVFRTVPREQMPAEYTRHQWLIYGACPTLATVGYPLMIAEAQAAGVGVIAYDLRPEMADYVQAPIGRLYKTPADVLAILAQPPPDAAARATARAVAAARYDIRVNIAALEAAAFGAA